MSKLPDFHCTVKNKDKVFLNKVGIKGIKIPLLIERKDKKQNICVATIDLFASLSEEEIGVHMSRFSEIAHKYVEKRFNSKDMLKLLEEVQNRLGAQKATVSIWFDYFIQQIAPVSKKVNIVAPRVCFYGELNKDKYDFVIGLKMVGTSNCPCSKLLSEGEGAHGQRSRIDLWVKPKKFIWIEDLYEMFAQAFSCKIYNLLKRSDEKNVTITAYQHPKFVEMIVREAYTIAKESNLFYKAIVEVTNEESIHAYDAFAKAVYISEDQGGE